MPLNPSCSIAMAELRLNDGMNLISTWYGVRSDGACRFKRPKWVVELLRETSSDIGRIGLSRHERELLPTPQFIVVDANIDQGRITAIRLRHNSTQNARQEQDVQLNSVRTGQSSARQNATGESDRVIDAINAAFKRAQILETNNHTSDAGIATGAGELRGQRSVAAMGHCTP